MYCCSGYCWYVIGDESEWLFNLVGGSYDRCCCLVGVGLNGCLLW